MRSNGKGRGNATWCQSAGIRSTTQRRTEWRTDAGSRQGRRRYSSQRTRTHALFRGSSTTRTHGSVDVQRRRQLCTARRLASAGTKARPARKIRKTCLRVYHCITSFVRKCTNVWLWRCYQKLCNDRRIDCGQLRYKREYLHALQQYDATKNNNDDSVVTGTSAADVHQGYDQDNDAEIVGADDDEVEVGPTGRPRG